MYQTIYTTLYTSKTAVMSQIIVILVSLSRWVIFIFGLNPINIEWHALPPCSEAFYVVAQRSWVSVMRQILRYGVWKESRWLSVKSRAVFMQGRWMSAQRCYECRATLLKFSECVLAQSNPACFLRCKSGVFSFWCRPVYCLSTQEGLTAY